MRNCLLYLSCFSLVSLAACDSSDPFSDADGGGGGNDAAPQADSGPVPDGGTFACFDTPVRMVVLGDSIAACANVGGRDNAACGPKIFHEYVAANYASGVVYENVSVSGAVTTDVPDNQLANVTTGAGHVVVNIYVGGNDLQPYIFASDANAMAMFATDMPAMIADWERIFAFFDDATAFPDGVSIVMNNQYNPFDDCTAAPYNLSAVKIGLLGEYNTELGKLAAARNNVVITDQHGPYLGHGHHYEVQQCPYYQAGATPFMGDLIHPNAAGHANLAAQWETMADRMYRDCN